MNYKKYIYKLKNFYTREISSNAENKFRFSFLYFTGVLVIVLYFSFAIGIPTVKAKFSIVTKINTIAQNLKQNIKSVNALLPYLGVNDQTEFLAHAIPVESYPNIFLREFVLIASSNGFDVVNLNISKSTEGNLVTQNVSVRLQGSIINLPKLIKQIEDMKRFTSIKSISASSSKADLGSGIYLVNISLEIYSIDLNE